MAVLWNPRTNDYYWVRTDCYPTYTNSTTATSPTTYAFTYNPYVRKTKTFIDEITSEQTHPWLFEKPKPKPEPEPASEEELHDFLFGGEEK